MTMKEQKLRMMTRLLEARRNDPDMDLKYDLWLDDTEGDEEKAQEEVQKILDEAAYAGITPGEILDALHEEHRRDFQQLQQATHRADDWFSEAWGVSPASSSTSYMRDSMKTPAKPAVVKQEQKPEPSPVPAKQPAPKSECHVKIFDSPEQKPKRGWLSRLFRKD